MERENYPIPPNERIAAPNERRSGLTWLAGLVMVVLGVLFLFGQIWYSGDLFASILLMGFGATFFAVYLTNRKHWWALIPTYILMVTGAFIAIEPVLWGEGDAIYWLAAVGLPFLYLFVTDPAKRWWALIPTYVFASTGAFLIVEPILWGDLDGAYWLFAIALPFFAVYVTGPRNRWWALIPGGILASIGVGLFVSSIALVLPVAFIIAGIVLLTRQARQRRAADAPSMEPPAPRYGPEADRPAPEFEPLGAREPEPVVNVKYDR